MHDMRQTDRGLGWLAGVKPFRSVQTIEGSGMKDKGVTVVLGKMGVTRAKPSQPGGKSPVHQELGRIPAAGDGSKTASARWTSTRPGLRRAPGDGG